MTLLKIVLFLGLMAYACDVPAQTVYVTKTGDKYHKSSCHYLKNSKKGITFQEAKELRFTACSVCKPTAKINISANAFTTESPTNTQKATAQCTGKTKSGARCKRMTKSGSGRCYQH